MTKNINVVSLMREEYKNHLKNILSELKVFGDDGEILISKDLKVMHKDTGFEYTVKDVLNHSMQGRARVVLQSPEKARDSITSPEKLHPDFAVKAPSQGSKFVDEIGGHESETSQVPDQNDNDQDMKDSDTFEVPEKEFEKKYVEA